MKKILLIFCICFVASGAAFAANWEQISNKIYIDTGSIERYSDRYGSGDTKKYSFWIKNLNDGSSPFAKMEKLFNKKIWYMLSREIVDCDKKTIANKSIVIYDLKSETIDSIESNVYSDSWTSIVPDSIGELYYYAVCKPNALNGAN